VRETLLTEVATLYYVDRFTQQQIARQIGRSVATVSRLLSEAEAKEDALLDPGVDAPGAAG